MTTLVQPAETAPPDPVEERPVLVIGDVQGHFDRLERLLLQEGIIGSCGVCGGSGDVSSGTEEDPFEFCDNCDGTGTTRINRDVTVVQLGDLIDATPRSQSTDSLCVKFGDKWLDYVLWGNHDRPVIDFNRDTVFGGYLQPEPSVVATIQQMHTKGRYRLAYEAHGFLLVHAGLPVGPAYDNLKVQPGEPGFADYLEELDCDLIAYTERHLRGANTYGDLVWTPEIETFRDLRDNIGPTRGGWHPYGGLLWRDAREPLYDTPQIFAHSSAELVRTFAGSGPTPSYCLDLSKHGKLGAIWLPSERVVTC